MSTLPLWIAAGVAVFLCAVHGIAGGKDTATPIAKSRDLDVTAKHTALLVWYMMTVALPNWPRCSLQPHIGTFTPWGLPRR